MHSEVLTKEQKDLLPLIGKFKKKFGLVGGTAIALQIGHRESIDFDLFSPNEFTNSRLRRTFAQSGKKIETLRSLTGQFTFIVDTVYITFFHFPYPINYSKEFETYARMPDLLSLAAMKAFAIGQRSKWRDYVDMYFIMRDFHSLMEITEKAESLFGSEFNAKLFRQQLAYFADVDYRQLVNFKPGFETPEKEIRSALQEWSIS